MDVSNHGSHSVRTYVTKAPAYLRKTVRRWCIRRYRSLYFRLHPRHRSLDGDRALASTARADSVLFLCWGNICRSPLAERYCRHRLLDRGVTDVDVRSAGLGSVEGRDSPESAVEASAEYGVDLSDHTSSLVTARQLRAADVVFVMDLNNYHSAVDRLGDPENVFFLGSVLPEHDGPVVPDPHGGDERTFTETYRTVTDAVDRLVDALTDRPTRVPSGAPADEPDDS